MTILSNGAGQDTTYLIWRIAHDPEFKARHVKGDLIVVGSDTGIEHPHTYANERAIRAMCKEFGIEYYWVTPDMGFHPKTWQSLQEQYRRTNTIGSAAFQQTCTDNLKVKVVDNFLEYYLRKKKYEPLWGEHWNKVAPFRKQIFDEVAIDIRLILGFASKEESRTSKGNKFDAKWKQKWVTRYYALIIEGIDRQGAINYNEANIPWKVWPSNCMICFYSSDQEILWLYRFYPNVFWEWVTMERAKLTKWYYKGLEQPPKNYGVYGLTNLQQKLQKAQDLYGHWTDEQLNEYKYSHGHCIKSKY